MSVVDPALIIEKRVREALAPMRQALAESSDPAERRKIRSAIWKRERAIRAVLGGNGAAW